MITEAFRLVLASYLLLLAIGAVFGFHQSLLAYPIRIAYSASRLLLMGMSGGKIRITPLTRKVRRHGGGMIRGFWEVLSDRHAAKTEEGGPHIRAWRSGANPDEVNTSPDLNTLVVKPDWGEEELSEETETCPLHGVPLDTSLHFDDQTGLALPLNTTHIYCLKQKEEGTLFSPINDEEDPLPPSFH